MTMLDRLDDLPEVEAAQARVKAARARLIATAEDIQARISPRNLMEEAVSGARARSSAAVESASKAVHDRPGLAALGAAAIGLVIGGPIARRLRRPHDARDATSAPDRPFSPR